MTLADGNKSLHELPRDLDAFNDESDYTYQQLKAFLEKRGVSTEENPSGTPSGG